MKIYLSYIVLIFYFSAPINAISQPATLWETADSTAILSLGNWNVGGPNGIISGYKNNFVRIGMMTRMFWANVLLYTVVQRYSKESGKLEIILGDSLNKTLQFWCIQQVNENMIVVGGDSAFFQGSFLIGGNYRDYYLFTGMLFISKDNGKTWDKKYLDSNFVIGSISMSDSLNGYAIGYYQTNYYNKPENAGQRVLLVTNDGWSNIDKVLLPDDVQKSPTYLKSYSKDTLAIGSTWLKDKKYIAYSYNSGRDWDYNTFNQLDGMNDKYGFCK